MRRAVLLLAVAALAASTRPVTAQAATDTTPTVSQLVVGTVVQNLQPAGVADTFPADVGTVACFMAVEGHFATTELYHVWMHGDQQMARVPLVVKGPTWRTWSTKKILPAWTGAWSVKVEDAQGNVLKSVDFTIQ